MDMSSTVGKSNNERIRTYSPFVGFCFIVNYIVGSGFLAVPYVLWHTGIIVGVCTLVVISFFIAIPAFWTLEIMARAQVSFFTNRSSAYKIVWRGSSRVSYKRFRLGGLLRGGGREGTKILVSGNRGVVSRNISDLLVGECVHRHRRCEANNRKKNASCLHRCCCKLRCPVTTT